jgi:hypothetical protein
MRRIVFTGLIILVSFLQGYGKAVTIQDVRNATQSFITAAFPAGKTYLIVEIIPLKNDSKISMYAVNLKPGGWILISGDDKTIPVLGYSVSGSFDPAFPPGEGVGEWIKHYSKNIAGASQDKSLKRDSRWDGNAGSFALKSAAITPVAPLITVTWDQGKNWNNLCPSDVAGPGGHAYVGCVGVCMAQAMSYYKYPVKPTGDKTYYHSTYGSIIMHYDRQSPYEWDSMSLNTPDVFNSKLLYHCAVSVGMNFGADGSSAQTKNAASALVRYFKYFGGARYVDRYDNDTTWTNLLIDELSAGRPVIYSGFPEDNSPGHAFDIDGVDLRGYFHLNWGWTGKYNAYYLVNNLNPGTFSFNRNQGAIINLRPPVYCPTDLDLSKKTVKERMPVGSYVGRLKITDEAPDNQYTFTLMGDSIGIGEYLPADFYLSHDTLRTNREFLYSEQNAIFLYIKVKDEFDHTYIEKFSISILENSIPSGISTDNEENFTVYPNPTRGKIYFQVPASAGGTSSISLIDPQGHIVLNREYKDENTLHELDYAIPGLYFLRIKPINGPPILKKIIVY